MNTACAPVLVAVLFVAGCASSGSVFVSEPIVDTRVDAQGHVVIRDTPRMWAEWSRNIDALVADESKGARPPGVETWQRHWELVIKENTGTRDNDRR
jgi:capsid protein